MKIKPIQIERVYKENRLAFGDPIIQGKEYDSTHQRDDVLMIPCGHLMRKSNPTAFLQLNMNNVWLLSAILVLLLSIVKISPLFNLLFSSLTSGSYGIIDNGFSIGIFLFLLINFVLTYKCFISPIYKIWMFSVHADKTIDNLDPNELYLGTLKKWLQSQSEVMIGQQLDSIADVKALQSQIHPHFLYNTLDSLRGELHSREMTDLAEMIEMLSDFFRYSISQSDPLIPLESELENTEKYIHIMQFRFPNKFIVKKQFDVTDRSLMSAMLPKLILQPIVENSISHGLETKLGQGQLVITAFRTEKTLCLQIGDDGLGIPPERLELINEQLSSNGAVMNSQNARGMGLAMLNINKRIRLLYGQEYGVSISSSLGSGTQVQIMLPFNKE